MKPQTIVMGFMLLIFCLSAGAADRKYIVKPRASDMKALPFSDGVLVGNTLYIAGHIGLDAKTGAPPAGVEDEARLVMDGIKNTVESAGMTMDDVVTIQVFCTDLVLRNIQQCLQNVLSRRLSCACFRWSGQLAARRPLRGPGDRGEEIEQEIRVFFARRALLW